MASGPVPSPPVSPVSAPTVTAAIPSTNPTPPVVAGSTAEGHRAAPDASVRRTTGSSASARAPKASSHATEVDASAAPADRGAPADSTVRAAWAVTTSHPVAARHASSVSAAVRDRTSTDWARALARCSAGAVGLSGSRNSDTAATTAPTSIATGASTPTSASVSSVKDGAWTPVAAAA